MGSHSTIPDWELSRYRLVDLSPELQGIIKECKWYTVSRKYCSRYSCALAVTEAEPELDGLNVASYINFTIYPEDIEDGEPPK